MNFPYTLSIVRAISSGEEIVVLRPEVPIRIHGPKGFANVQGLVDTGADSCVFPMSIARELEIQTTSGIGPGATAFGGQNIPLSFADVEIEFAINQPTPRWPARVYFADFPDSAEKAVVLGHEGFLDFFTATFDGEECVLDLQPNDSLPHAEKSN